MESHQIATLVHGHYLLESPAEPAGCLVGFHGYGEDADLVRNVNLAARTGAGLICRDLAAAQAAVGHGIAPDRILVWCAPAQIERAAESGWATLVDVDAVAGSPTDADAGPESQAGVLAVAAVCGWLGASVIWTPSSPSTSSTAPNPWASIGNARPARLVRLPSRTMLGTSTTPW